MSGEFIPNSYQTPNIYVDKFMAYLTPEEWMVLSYFVRRIIGFRKRQDRIAYSQVMDGIVTQSDERLDYGTGLGASATKNAIRALIDFGLIIEVEPNDPHKNTGPLYGLQLDSDAANFQAMVERKASKTQKHDERMAKARDARLSNRPGSNGQTRHYPLDAPSHYPITAPPPLSNNTHNNKRKPVENKDSTHQEIFKTLARICKLDMKLKAGQIGKTAKSLAGAGYTAADVDTFAAWWKSNDFRGRKGEPPTLANVTEKILQAKQSAKPAQQKSVLELTVINLSDHREYWRGDVLERTEPLEAE